MTYYLAQKKIDVLTRVAEDLNKAYEKGYYLYRNYPGQFIRVQKSNTQYRKRGRQQFIESKIYDILGRGITTLVNDEKPAGSYEVNFNASEMPSGVYFYQLKPEILFKRRKRILIR